MMENIHLNSLKVAQLEVLSSTKASLGFATGFFCIYKNQYFLITNWHVVSGRNFQTNEILHKSGAEPVYLNINFHYSSNRNDTKLTSHSFSFEMCLYRELDMERPIYFTHPTLNSKIDVVAIPFNLIIEGTENNEVICVDVEKELMKDVNIQVMQSLFIVGFPINTKLTPNRFPVYKHGTIATEPYVYDELPIFYIDGKTKRGMSGSQVIYKQDLDVRIDKNIMHTTKGRIDFIGIYSGRERDENNLYEAELGIIWHYKECLVPILDKYLETHLISPNSVDFYA